MSKRTKCRAGLSMLMAVMLITSMVVWSAPLSASAATTTKVIQILGTSDLHGRFDAYSYASNTPNTAGGLTQLSQKVKELRNENANTLLVDAGDTIQDNMANIFLNDSVHPMFVAMRRCCGYTEYIRRFRSGKYFSAAVVPGKPGFSVRLTDRCIYLLPIISPTVFESRYLYGGLQANTLSASTPVWCGPLNW